ncbi:MAG: Rossmann fold nucleotide-binding protein [Nocardioidaceae bacterium]
MKHPSRRAVEVETLAEFDRRTRTGTRALAGWQVQDVDLRERTEVLRGVDPRDALFLGCPMHPEVEDELRSRGALVFPTVPDVPLDVYRSRLYTPDELYAGLDRGYGRTLDARTYAWTRRSGQLLRDRLAQALHDLAIDDALEELVRARHMVGVMGGHGVVRGSAAYLTAAELGRSLTRAGLTVATGGGPGAMEAANLGAHLAGHDDTVLDEALGMLSRAPAFTPSVTRWAEAAFDVRRRWPSRSRSLGVPTWYYGHEPPNVFASDVAKYVRNAIREDVLLHLCAAGIVFLPGLAGTVQEVFQDACDNYYAHPAGIAPMVLVGTAYWTDELPVWPLLRTLAADREMAGSVHLVEEVDDALAVLSGPDGRLLK